MTYQPRSSGAVGRLLYTSECGMAGSRAEIDRQVRGIAEASAARNQDRGLTGMLVYVGDTFIQILEGPGESIEQTFEDICCDLRHHNLALVDYVTAPSRLFDEWRMAYLSEHADTSQSYRDELHEIGLMVGVNAREAQRQMRDLLDRVAA
jgi:hypothetical protein